METTDSLLTVVYQASKRLNKIDLVKLDSINNAYNKYKILLEEKEILNDTLGFYFKELGKNLEVGMKNFREVETQIAFSTEDLDKLKLKIRKKNDTDEFIDRYLYYASTAVEAIDIRSGHVSTFLKNQMNTFKILVPHIEKELSGVNQ